MAKAAVGTIFKIGTDAIAELTSIGGLDLTAETIDVTALDSTGGYREFIAGFKDAGEVALSGWFYPGDTGQAALYAAFGTGALSAFTIQFPAAIGASWIFNAVVTKYSTAAEVEGAVSFEATVKVSGAPSLATTASAGLSGLELVGTGGTFAPTFANTTYYYVFTGVTADSVTIKATTAQAQTILLYVDGVYTAALTSAQASDAITMAIGTKKLTIVANEVGKTAKQYDIIVEKAA